MRNFVKKAANVAKRTLVLLLALVTVIAAIAIIGWSSNLKPMATDWGNYAAWAGVVVTILGVYYAVQSLLAEGVRRRQDETDQRRASARSISAVGSISSIQLLPGDIDPPATRDSKEDWPMPPADAEWDHVIQWTVVNDSALPVRNVVIRFPLINQDGTVAPNAYSYRWVGTVTVNKTGSSEIPPTRTKRKPEIQGFVDFAVSFTDAWDTRWDSQADGTLVPNGTFSIPTPEQRYRNSVL